MLYVHDAGPIAAMFDSTSYSVYEGDRVSLRITLKQTVTSDVVLSVVTEDDSAVGKLLNMS